MNSFLAVGAATGMLVVSSCLLVRWLILLGANPGEPAGTEEVAGGDFDQRLRSPNWRELEAHFGVAVPSSLRKLYADRRRVGRKSFYVVPPHAADEDQHHYIARFEPADLRTIGSVWFPLDERRFPFASDDSGNYFYAKIADDERDPRVYFLEEKDGRIERVADSLSEFLTWKTYGSRRL